MEQASESGSLGLSRMLPNLPSHQLGSVDSLEGSPLLVFAFSACLAEPSRADFAQDWDGTFEWSTGGAPCLQDQCCSALQQLLSESDRLAFQILL